jgi:hypothetical protein
MKFLLVYKMKKILIIIGVILVIALVFYLGVKSGKAIETILSTGFIGGIATFINWKRIGNNRRGSGENPGISIAELESIRGRYRDANDRIQRGLTGAKSEAGQLREGLQRDRERIRGYENAGSGVREAADELDDLIRRIQEEGIDP